jgi:hypothetical protein
LHFLCVGTVQNETLSFVYIAFELLGLKNFNLYEYEAMVYAFFGKSQAQRILEYYPGTICTNQTTHNTPQLESSSFNNPEKLLNKYLR